jgi:hypothetical protein
MMAKADLYAFLTYPDIEESDEKLWQTLRQGKGAEAEFFAAIQLRYLAQWHNVFTVRSVSGFRHPTIRESVKKTLKTLGLQAHVGNAANLYHALQALFPDGCFYDQLFAATSDAYRAAWETLSDSYFSAYHDMPRSLKNEDVYFLLDATARRLGLLEDNEAAPTLDRWERGDVPPLLATPEQDDKNEIKLFRTLYQCHQDLVRRMSFDEASVSAELQAAVKRRFDEELQRVIEQYSAADGSVDEDEFNAANEEIDAERRKALRAIPGMVAARRSTVDRQKFKELQRRIPSPLAVTKHKVDLAGALGDIYHLDKPSKTIVNRVRMLIDHETGRWMDQVPDSALPEMTLRLYG